MTILKLEKVTKFFGKLAAIDDISLEVSKGERVGIVGPNGSGKTTMFNVISGFCQPSRGELQYNGNRITNAKPHQIASLGLIRGFQSNILYKEATVYENIIRGSYLSFHTNAWQTFFNTPMYRSEAKRIYQRADKILDFWGLSDVHDVSADRLSHGHQRRLGIAIAVAAEPKVLLLDEPVSGMSGEEISDVMSKIGELSNQGITILLIEHHVQTVVDFSQRLVALNYGHVIANGPPKEVTSKKEVIEAYLGTEEIA